MKRKAIVYIDGYNLYYGLPIRSGQSTRCARSLKSRWWCSTRRSESASILKLSRHFIRIFRAIYRRDVNCRTKYE